jgi:hypothetical protein
MKNICSNNDKQINRWDLNRINYESVNKGEQKIEPNAKIQYQVSCIQDQNLSVIFPNRIKRINYFAI